MENRNLVPVIEGFQYECQYCGMCCEKYYIQLTLDELRFFIEHNIPVAYYIRINIETKKVEDIFPCKPPGVLCAAQEMNSKRCLVYKQRPGACRLYPFVFRTYHKRPPTYEETTQSLVGIDLTGVRLKSYYHRLDKARWLFVGCRVGVGCPGVGKGIPWRRTDIQRFITSHLYWHLTLEDNINETRNVILDVLGLNTETDVERYFELTKELESVDKSRIGIYVGKKYDLTRLTQNLILQSDLRGLQGNMRVDGGKL